MSRYDNSVKDTLYESVYYEMLTAHEDHKLSWDKILEIVFAAIQEALYAITKED